MNNSLFKDFYFIYVLTGTNYIKTVIKSFDFIPEDANVVIITNTPKILDNVKTKFNLIVQDLESLRPDWSRKYEYVLNIEDEVEYMQELSNMYDSGYRYPMGILRYGLKWAIQNNITKLAIIDGGDKINYHFKSEDALIALSEFAKEKDLIFGSIFFIENSELSKPLILGEYNEVVKKYFPFINEDNYPKYILNKTEMPLEHLTDTGFDGHTFGFWFKDISRLETLFNFWEDLTEFYYNNNKIVFSSFHWIVDFEFLILIISSIYIRYFDVFVCGHKNIISHLYTPENDFFGVALKYRSNPIFVETKTRHDFLRVNRQQLIDHYGGLENANNLIYGFKEINKE